MLPIKLPGPSSRSPKPKQIPHTLPFKPTMHGVYSVQTNCGVYMWAASQQPTGASSGRRLNSLPRLTSSITTIWRFPVIPSLSSWFSFFGLLLPASTRSAPRPEWGKNLQNTMLENKPGNKKSWHISGKRNIQMRRITGLDSSGRIKLGMQDGLKAGMNQPVVHPPDGTRNGGDPKRLEVTSPPGLLVVQYSAA